MKPTLYTIARVGPGRLSTMAKPRGGDWLEDELKALAFTGVSAVVCLLTDAELTELDLRGEAAAAEAAGVAFVAVPTTDRGLPDRSVLAAVVPDLAARLERGDHVVAHCRYGIGRSSVVAAAVLVHEGVDPDEAWRLIETARGRPVPDTEEQRAFVASLAR